MSCGLLLAASLLFSDPTLVPALAQTPPAATTSALGAPASVANEPLFADIVARSGTLKTIVEGWAANGTADADGFAASAVFSGFKIQAAELAAADLQGHLVLKERGTDGDLKCILRGISEDMPLKVAAVEAATDKPARDLALSELAYLLNDNVEVITSPPIPTV